MKSTRTTFAALDAALARVPHRVMDDLAKSVTKAKLLQKIKDGEWEVSVDVAPAIENRRAIEVRETRTDKKFWVRVNDSSASRATGDAFDAALARIPNCTHVRARDKEYIHFVVKPGRVEWRSNTGRTGSDPTTTPIKTINELVKRFNLSPEDYEVTNDSHTKRALDAALSHIPDRRRSGRAFTLRGGLDATLARGRDAEPDQKRVQEALSAMSRLRQTFKQGENRYGEYGKNTSAAYERWAKTYKELTGKSAPSIYDSVKDAHTSLDRLDAALAHVPDRRRARDAAKFKVDDQVETKDGQQGYILDDFGDGTYEVQFSDGRTKVCNGADLKKV